MSREISDDIKNTEPTPGRYGEGAYTQEEAEYGQAKATAELREVNQRIHSPNSGFKEKGAAKTERGRIILTLDYYRKILTDIKNKVRF